LHGGYTPGPLLAFAALAGLAGAVIALAGGLAAARGRSILSSRQRELALACLLVFGSALAVLLASDLFEFSWRYQLPALVTLPPAGALGLALLGSLQRRRAPAGHPQGRNENPLAGSPTPARSATPAGPRPAAPDQADRDQDDTAQPASAQPDTDQAETDQAETGRANPGQVDQPAPSHQPLPRPAD
jgi:hypothetical protein